MEDLMKIQEVKTPITKEKMNQFYIKNNYEL